ncbi:hydroxyproline-rich systemin B-like [Nicotiana sylvestris]|uniref:Hydroxyproline-rich systemin A-like n=1 Tax=Nicotiana sylvestris TaxID=4096 RepID=A0A1U7VDI4_NICSY|nr:PREDICTED: hydroxyproline-rich systemin A-like [Nicotiana sylvestris]
MTKMILFVRANFFLIYFLFFIRSEARTLLENHYGREPVPLPPTPESASPSNQERLKRHAHLPPPAPKHGPKIDQVTTSRYGREISELLMTITSNVISDNELLILLPSTSSDNQERFGKQSHLPPPAPKPADEQGQIIVTSSNCQDHDHMNSNNYGREEKILPPPTPKPADEEGEISITSSTTTNDDQNSNYIGREGRILPPPSPHHAAPIGQLTSRYGGQGLKPYKSLISSLPLQAS